MESRVQIPKASASAFLSMIEKISHARSNTSGSYVGGTETPQMNVSVRDSEIN